MLEPSVEDSSPRILPSSPPSTRASTAPPGGTLFLDQLLILPRGLLNELRHHDKDQPDVVRGGGGGGV